MATIPCSSCGRCRTCWRFTSKPREAFPPLSDLDPYACNLRLQAISAGDRDEIAKIFRLVPDQVRIISIPLDALPSRPHGCANDDNQTLIRTVIEAQCELLRVFESNRRFRRLRRRRGTSGNECSAPRRSSAIGGYGGSAPAPWRCRSTTPDRCWRRSNRHWLRLPARDRRRSPKTPTGRTSLPADATERPADRVLRVRRGENRGPRQFGGRTRRCEKCAWRIRQSASNRLLAGHEVAASIQRDHDAIDRLVVELHGTILQLRMVPVAQVFRSFPRLVRDMSRQLDKNVTLVTRGETTEADKTIVDRLFEPLVHLVRNAMDHGIESPAQRRAAGKPETATISIEASRIGDRFVVEVTDDGRGIDPAVIRRKASEKRLMPADELAALDRRAGHRFGFCRRIFDRRRSLGYFRPRHRNGCRAHRDRADRRPGVAGEPVGAGTTVRLDLPMTIAMSRIMVVEAGGQLFGISMDAVSETVRVTPDRISRIKNNVGFVLRDRIVPIVSLAELMKLPERAKDVAAGETFGRRGSRRQDGGARNRRHPRPPRCRLKPMQGLLADARGYAGTTLLGDGQVLLVLDMKEIIAMTVRRGDNGSDRARGRLPGRGCRSRCCSCCRRRRRRASTGRDAASCILRCSRSFWRRAAPRSAPVAMPG